MSFRLMHTKAILVMILYLGFVTVAQAKSEWFYEIHNTHGEIQESLSIYLFDDNGGQLWLEYIYVFEEGRRTRSAIFSEGRRLLSPVNGLNECYHVKMFGSDEAIPQGEELLYLVCIAGDILVLTNISGTGAAILPNHVMLSRVRLHGASPVEGH